jgi:hypothetical protein
MKTTKQWLALAALAGMVGATVLLCGCASTSGVTDAFTTAYGQYINQQRHYPTVRVIGAVMPTADGRSVTNGMSITLSGVGLVELNNSLAPLSIRERDPSVTLGVLSELTKIVGIGGVAYVAGRAVDQKTVINQPAPTPPAASEMPVSQPRPGIMGRIFGFRP